MELPVYPYWGRGSPPAGRRCSDEVALLCSEKQCNDIVKASGTNLGGPHPPHLHLLLPCRAPWACRFSPPPCPAGSLLHGNLRSWPGLGLWGQRAPFPPGRGPAPVGLHSWSEIPTDRPPGEARQALAGLPDTLSLLHYCGLLGSSAMMKGHQSGLVHHTQQLAGGSFAASVHFPGLGRGSGLGWTLHHRIRFR